MTGRITTCEGKTFDLPPLLSWDVSYTGAVPCDCFFVTCPYGAKMEPILRLAAGFTLLDGDRVLLRGFVDEYEIHQTAAGRWAALGGRGYAGRLLDNESRAITYQQATLAEVVRNHVTPYGIPCDALATISAGEPYTVAAGSSQWKALAEFCQTYGGFTPQFDRYGRLRAAPETAERTMTIGPDTAVLELVKREDSYGVLSEVLVIDKSRRQEYSVKNPDFIRRGGQCRRVLYTPGQSSWAAGRYTGDYQIRQSQAEAVQVEVTLPGGFLAFPGDSVELALPELGLSGSYRAAEIRVTGDHGGQTTELTLRERA